VPSRRCLSSEFVRIHCDAAIPHPVAQDGPSGRSRKSPKHLVRKGNRLSTSLNRASSTCEI
jgi:hypothetical protein